MILFTVFNGEIASRESRFNFRGHGRQKPWKKGGDLNREMCHIKCQWYKNVRAEAAESF